MKAIIKHASIAFDTFCLFVLSIFDVSVGLNVHESRSHKLYFLWVTSG